MNDAGECLPRGLILIPLMVLKVVNLRRSVTRDFVMIKRLFHMMEASEREKD